MKHLTAMGAVVLLALLLRLGWVSRLSTDPKSLALLPDQREYLALGQNLLEHHQLHFVDPRFGQIIYAYRMPGYPAVVAACGAQIRIVRIVQVVIDVSTVLAVYALGRWAGGPQGTGRLVGLLAALIAAGNPFQIFFCGCLLSETVFIALFTWAVLATVHRRWVWAAGLMVAAMYVRPAALFMAPPLFMIAGAISLNPRPATAYRWIARCRPALVASIFLPLSLLPWAWRNHQMLHHWIWTTTNSGVTLYDGFNPQADGSSDQRFLVAMPRVGLMNEADRSQALSQSAWRWAVENPNRWPLLMLRKFARGWSPVPLSAEFGKMSYRVISAIYSVPVDVFGVIGLWQNRLPLRRRLLLLTPAVLVTVVQMMSVGSIRYRLPAEPMLAVLAASGLLGAVGLFTKKEIGLQDHRSKTK